MFYLTFPRKCSSKCVQVFFAYFDTATESSGSRQEQEQEVEEGADVVLDCSEGAQRQRQFRWIKDGAVLRNSRKYLVEGSLLTIRRAIQNDQGLYECFDENVIGFAKNSIRLRVLGKCCPSSVFQFPVTHSADNET